LSAAKSRITFAIGTLLSRVTGLLSYSIKGAVFGASVYQDAFLTAYKIPNLLRDMLAEGALGSSFTKVFSSLWEEDEARARKVFIDSLWLVFFGLTIVCGIGIIAAPLLVDLVTMVSDSNEQGPLLVAQATGMTRALFPFILFMSLGSIVSGALHQRGKFFLSSISSVALNLGFILGSLVFSRVLESVGPDWIETIFANRGIMGLVLGVLLGGFLQLVVQVSGIWKPLLKGRIYRPKPFPLSPDVKKVLSLMGPMIIASSSGLINVMVNSNFATSLNSGAVTWLDNAFRLIHLPVGIFGVALGTVALPTLTRAVAKAGGRVDLAVSKELQINLELILWLIFPCLLFVMIDSLEIVQALYQYGKFTPADSGATADAMFAYSFGLLGLGSIKVLSSFYYAINRTGYAMKVSLFSIAANFLANYLFVQKFGHVGLAITASSVVSLNALLLLVGIMKERPTFNWSDLRQTLGYIFLASAGAVFIKSWSHYPIDWAFGLDLDARVHSMIMLVLNGCFLLGFFALAAMGRFQLSPKMLMKTLQTRKRVV
jgi:putative peptidoglycan lipid II flippase